MNKKDKDEIIEDLMTEHDLDDSGERDSIRAALRAAFARGHVIGSEERDEDPYEGTEFEGDGIHSPMPDGTMFADPTGVSALRKATPSNPRDQPCPTCERSNRLTRADVRLGYQCDSCAENAERGFPFGE